MMLQLCVNGIQLLVLFSMESVITVTDTLTKIEYADGTIYYFNDGLLVKIKQVDANDN